MILATDYMKKTNFLILICIFVLKSCIAFSNEVLISSKSGLKFNKSIASIKTSKANVRFGPGEQFPIKWTYFKRHWPILLIDKFDHWKKIKTVDNTIGWIHDSQISRTKTSLVIFSDYLRKYPETKSKKIAFLKKKVLVEIKSCRISWCEVQVVKEKYNGWYIKNYLWEANLVKIND